MPKYLLWDYGTITRSYIVQAGSPEEAMAFLNSNPDPWATYGVGEEAVLGWDSDYDYEEMPDNDTEKWM